MRKLHIATIAVALAFSAFLPAAKADIMAYASTNGGLLYLVDLSNATATEIGNTGISAMEGLSLSPGGTLYGTDLSGNLYTINQSTGAVTLIGSTGLGDIEGLAFDGSTLLAAPFNYDTSTSTTLYSINTATAAATSVTTATTGAVRGMTLEDANDVFVTSDRPTFMSLETVNLSGTVTDDGTLADTSGGFVEVTALAYNGSTLWGLDTSGNEYIINPITAAETLVGNVDDLFFLDMSLAPTPVVPEPSTWAILIIGLAGLGGARYRGFRRSAAPGF
jgi:PEP-CTERM motif